MRHIATFAAVVAVLFIGSSCPAQEFGHKLLGGLGLQAGVQPDTGLYVGDQVVVLDSHQFCRPKWSAVPGLFRLERRRRRRRRRLQLSPATARHLRERRRLDSDRPHFRRERQSCNPYRPRRPRRRLRTAASAGLATAALRSRDRLRVLRARRQHLARRGADGRESRTVDARALVRRDGVLRPSRLLEPVGARRMGHQRTARAESTSPAARRSRYKEGLAKTFAGIVSVGPGRVRALSGANDRGTEVPPALVGARDRAFGLGGELDLTLEKGRTSALLSLRARPRRPDEARGAALLRRRRDSRLEAVRRSLAHAADAAADRHVTAPRMQPPERMPTRRQQIRSFTVARPSIDTRRARRAERRCVNRSRARGTRSSTFRAGPIRSRCCKSRSVRASPSWCRFATGEWWRRRSHSSAARRW